MMNSQPDQGGHFGPYGGRFVPEVLMAPIEELEKAYLEAREDPAFQAELAGLLHTYAGRPTPLYFAKRLSEPAQLVGGGAALLLGENAAECRQGRAQPTHCDPHLVHALGASGKDRAFVAQCLIETRAADALQSLLGAHAGVEVQGLCSNRVGYNLVAGSKRVAPLRLASPLQP